MSIILYHYSDKTHDPLKTREAQGFVLPPDVLKEELKQNRFMVYPDLYDRQISFFLLILSLEIYRISLMVDITFGRLERRYMNMKLL